MRRSFFAGLAILLPLVVTLWVVIVFVKLLTNPFLGFAENLLLTFGWTFPGFLFFSGQEFLRLTCQLLILIALFFIITAMGLATRSYIFNHFVDFSEWLFLKIPFISKVYQACKDVVKTLLGHTEKKFGAVVLAPFPHKEQMSIGLVTNEATKGHTADDDLISVFIPTTPNPTMGFVLLYRRGELIFTDMGVEKAVKSVISCGIMMPSFGRIKTEG